MNDIATTPPATIRARIHESAVKRVTRIYASTLSDAMTEALQNSRRAGATRVRISIGTLTDRPAQYAPATDGTLLTVTIADDGAGIFDPAVLLSFGENGWSDDLVRREDAAGFGFASLSRRGCTVSSRPRSPDSNAMPGWRVDLAPEHFLGEAEAEVRTDDGAPFPHGTSISFQARSTITSSSPRPARSASGTRACSEQYIRANRAPPVDTLRRQRATGDTPSVTARRHIPMPSRSCHTCA